MERKRFYVRALVGLGLMIAAFFAAFNSSETWCDELTFQDAAINFLRTGTWHSDVFYFVNSPGYPILSALWSLTFGVSHETTILFNFVLAYLASLYILNALKQRGLITSLLQELVFLFLFWSGCMFSKTIAMGRPDILTLLIASILLNKMFPLENKNASCRTLFGLSFVLMLVSAYAHPLLGLISSAGLLCARTRRTAFVRTLALVAGDVVGLMTIGLFYLYHHEAIRFAGFYASFNTITGERSMSLLSKLGESYTYDFFAPALVVLSALLIALCRPLKARSLLGTLIVIGAVPALMVLCGRYQPYYGWMFFVPAVVLLTIICGRLPRNVMLAILGFALFCWAVHFPFMPDKRDARNRQHDAETFIQAHAEYFQPGTLVVVAEDTVDDVSLYYPLRKRHVDLWFRGQTFLTSFSDEQKFEYGLSLFVKDAERRKKTLDQVMKYQRVMPLMPTNEALVVFSSPEGKAKTLSVMRSHGYAFKELASDGVRTLCRLTTYAHETAAFLSARDPSVQDGQIKAIRAATSGNRDALNAVRNRRNVLAPLPDGVEAEMISPTLRLYRPKAKDNLPLLIYLHGGGWVIGSIASCSAFCGALAANGVAVLAVDYPLAPEHPYPAALNTVCDVFRSVRRDATRYRCDPERIAIGGDSSGGNLALAAALKLQADGVKPYALIAYYPVTEARADGTESWRQFATGCGMDAAFMDACNAAYLNGHTPTNPFVSPIFASDAALKALPPVHILAADHDVLRDQGRRFADRLTALGCAPRYELPKGSTHLYVTVPGQPTAFNRAVSFAHEALTGK